MSTRNESYDKTKLLVVRTTTFVTPSRWAPNDKVDFGKQVISSIG